MELTISIIRYGAVKAYLVQQNINVDHKNLSVYLNTYETDQFAQLTGDNTYVEVTGLLNEMGKEAFKLMQCDVTTIHTSRKGFLKLSEESFNSIIF